MKKFLKLEYWLAALILIFVLIGFANASSTVSAGKYKLITDNLSEQIRADMSDKSLTVGINRASERRISDGQQALFGEAFFVSEDKTERTPVFFEIIVETPGNRVTSVDYTFLEGEALISEDFLQRLIIKQLGNDYKTTNVVIAIDNIERVEEKSEKYRGVGEVKIGGLVYKKIKFEISLEGDSESVLYQLGEL